MSEIDSHRWPSIPVAEWQDTRDTLHLYTQIVGKIRLANEPLVNHWWNTTLYVTANGLTTSLMRWFWGHYADPAQRQHPMASPLRAANLSDLPPALVVTCEFDPLRAEGAAYARAMAAAGVDVRHLDCRGQIHTSIPMVDVILSANTARAEIARALRGFFASAA